LDFSSYFPGMYVIRVIQDGKSFIGRVVKL
jgi:hypothetical protein